MKTPGLMNDGLVIGIPSIDAEHALLIDELDRLLSGPANAIGTERFSESVSRIGVKLLEHFRHEEAILKRCGLPQPEVASHIEAHVRILEQFTQFQFDMMSGKLMDCADIIEMIKSWVVSHVVVFDLKMRPYAHGVSPP